MKEIFAGSKTLIDNQTFDNTEDSEGLSETKNDIRCAEKLQTFFQ